MGFYGAIEAGGTKFVCAVGTGPGDLTVARFPTTTPDETLGRAVAFLRARNAERPIDAVGIGSFGPLDLREGSRTYGFITTTPKPEWRDVDVIGPLQRALGVPIGFDTDVNAAALGEWTWGAGRGLDDLLYLTIGTGIGGGAIVRGELLRGLLHPEMGHVALPRDRADAEAFAGACPFHRDCFEGLASGEAIASRWGRPAEALDRAHEAWELEARYVARALAGFVLTLSPERIVLGGGVIGDGWLLPAIRAHLQAMLNGYVVAPELGDGIDAYVVTPGLGDEAGVLGAIALAAQAEQRAACG